MTTLPEILKAACEFNTAAAAYLDAEEKYRQAGVARDAAERTEHEAGSEVRSLREPFEVARAKFVQLVGNRSAAGALLAALKDAEAGGGKQLATLPVGPGEDYYCLGQPPAGMQIVAIDFGLVPPVMTGPPADEPKVTEPPKRGREFI